MTEFGCEISVRTITSRTELEQIRDYWVAANRHPDADLDFYDYLIATHPDDFSPVVLVASSGNELVGILPGRLENRKVEVRLGYARIFSVQLRQLTFLKFISDQGNGTPMANEIVGRILSILKERTADRVALCNVEVGNEFHQALSAVALKRSAAGHKDITECWRTAIPNSMEEFLKQRSSKHRYWLRRMQRLLEKESPQEITYRNFKLISDVDIFCAAAEKVASHTYQRGLRVGFTDNAEARRRLRLAAEKGWFRGYVVFAGTEPLAFWSGRLYHKVMYLDSTGYNPAWRKYEVGTVLFLKMVEDLCAAGAEAIDYGIGTSFYKERFGNSSHSEQFISLYAPTLKAKVMRNAEALDAFINRTAKSLLRRFGLFDRVKQWWRQRLVQDVDRPDRKQLLQTVRR